MTQVKELVEKILLMLSVFSEAELIPVNKRPKSSFSGIG